MRTLISHHSAQTTLELSFLTCPLLPVVELQHLHVQIPITLFVSFPEDNHASMCSLPEPPSTPCPSLHVHSQGTQVDQQNSGFILLASRHLSVLEDSEKVLKSFKGWEKLTEMAFFTGQYKIHFPAGHPNQKKKKTQTQTCQTPFPKGQRSLIPLFPLVFYTYKSLSEKTIPLN